MRIGSVQGKEGRVKCEGWAGRQRVFNYDHRYPPRTDAIHRGVTRARMGKRITIRLFLAAQFARKTITQGMKFTM